MRRRLVVCGVLLGIAVAPSALAWDPPEWNRRAQAEDVGPTNPVVLPLAWALRVYGSTVSRVDGDRCPSYPTCSHYAFQAVQRHGPLLGIVLTAGRLISEADEAAFSPRIRVDGKTRVYSPVEDDLAFLRGPLEP